MSSASDRTMGSNGVSVLRFLIVSMPVNVPAMNQHSDGQVNGVPAPCVALAGPNSAVSVNVPVVAQSSVSPLNGVTFRHCLVVTLPFFIEAIVRAQSSRNLGTNLPSTSTIKTVARSKISEGSSANLPSPKERYAREDLASGSEYWPDDPSNDSEVSHTNGQPSRQGSESDPKETGQASSQLQIGPLGTASDKSNVRKGPVLQKGKLIWPIPYPQDVAAPTTKARDLMPLNEPAAFAVRQSDGSLKKVIRARVPLSSNEGTPIPLNGGGAFGVRQSDGSLKKMIQVRAQPIFNEGMDDIGKKRMAPGRRTQPKARHFSQKRKDFHQQQRSDPSTACLEMEYIHNRPLKKSRVHSE